MTKTKITSNIMENISNRMKNQGFSKENGKALVVINGSNWDISKQLGFIQDLKKNGYEVSIGFSFMAEKVMDTKKLIEIVKPLRIFREEDLFELKSILEEYSLIVGPNISMNTLSKVSLGMIDSFIPNLIWSFLYFGKKVYLDFSSVRDFMGGASKSKEITEIIEGHIASILSFGAIEMTSDKQIVGTKVNEINMSKDLITEKDIIKLHKNQGVLVINSKTVVTPLAKDKARELGMSIEIK